MISKLLRVVRSKQTIVSKETILRRRPLKEVHFDIGRCFSPAVWEFHWLSNERRYKHVRWTSNSALCALSRRFKCLQKYVSVHLLKTRWSFDFILLNLSNELCVKLDVYFNYVELFCLETCFVFKLLKMNDFVLDVHLVLGSGRFVAVARSSRFERR